MFQMKEQEKNPEELSEVDISNLPDKEVQGNNHKDVQRTKERLDEQSEKLEVFSKELENIKKDQTEMKNIITKIKKN